MPRNGFTQIRSFSYNTDLTLANEVHPETGMTQYFYHGPDHGRARLWIRQDAKGQQRKIEDTDYDQYSRPKTVKFFDSFGMEDLCQRVTYTYDAYQPNVGHNFSGGWGHVTSSSIGPGLSDTSAACAVQNNTDHSRTNQNFLQVFDYTPTGQIRTKELVFNQIGSDPSGTAGSPMTTTWDTSYTYDDEGYQTTVTYPTGQTHTTGLDFMKRPFSLYAHGTSGPIIQSVTYNAADQMTQMSWADNFGSVRDPDAYSYPAFTQTWSYNSFNQVTQIQTQNASGAPSTVDLNYGFPAGQNNGQVSSVASGLDTNYNATYVYDSLNRLSSVGGAKVQTYSYDGWGNLYSKTGDGQNFTLGVDASTNRLTGSGICYDPNGNMTGGGGGCPNGIYYPGDFVYDMSNRLVQAVSAQDPSRGGRERYWYTPDNQRVSTLKVGNAGVLSQVFFVRGAHGEMAAVCTAQLFGQMPVCDMPEVKWAGRLIRQNRVPVVTDRVGSVVANSPGSSYGASPNRYFLPFGDGPATTGSPVAGGSAFATYWADLNTGLNYADQRYQSSAYGRFMSADPYKASAGAEDPGSWNKYSYVQNDPVNFVDPNGMERVTFCYVYPGQWYCNPYPYSSVPQDAGSPNGEQVGGSRAGKTSDEVSAEKALVRLNKAIDKAISALGKAKCLELFGAAGLDPRTVLRDIQNGGGQYGHFSFEAIETFEAGYKVNAKIGELKNKAIDIGQGATQLVTTSVNITINTSEGNFVENGYSDTDRAITVIHELGHAFAMIYGAGGSQIRQDGPSVSGGAAISVKNSALVRDKCF